VSSSGVAPTQVNVAPNETFTVASGASLSKTGHTFSKWKDVGNKAYPVYRPTIRVNKYTPLTIDEIDKTNLKKQIKQKQIIRGERDLPPFQKKN
jgi:hypothetical protein